MRKLIKGRWVIGAKPFTKKQILKVYWLLGLLVLFILYLIIREFICSCLYLIAGEGILFMMILGVIFVMTATWFRRQQRKNFIYEDEQE